MKDFKMPTGKELEKVLVELNKARKALGAPELSKDQFDKMATRQEGGNGFVLGEIVQLTGEVGLVPVSVTNDNGDTEVRNTYFGAKLSDGRWISLRNLIKPSLAGYKFEGTFEETDGSKKTNEYTAQHVEGFDPANVKFYDAGTRNVLELYLAAKEAASKGNNILPKKLILKAQGCRPIIARRDSTLDNLSYSAGAHRVMRVNVWAIS